MNFTWFASSYDCDDVPYRLLTLRPYGRLAVLAAGIPELFDTGTVGTRRRRLRRHALRHGRHVAPGRRRPPARARTALAYAVGIAVVQVLWIARLLLQGHAALLGRSSRWSSSSCSCRSWRSGAGITPVHPHHIAERYALLTLIVLGEVILASVQAVQAALEQGADPGAARHSSSAGCSSSSRCGGSTSSGSTRVLFEGSIREHLPRRLRPLPGLRLGGRDRCGARRGRRPRPGRGARVGARGRARAGRGRRGLPRGASRRCMPWPGRRRRRPGSVWRSVWRCSSSQRSCRRSASRCCRSASLLAAAVAHHVWTTRDAA